MSTRALALWFGGALLLAMLLLTPLRLVIDPLGAPRGLSATEVAGSAWSGRLRGAHWRGQALGDVGLRLRPLPLLAGVRRLRLQNSAAGIDVLGGRLRGIAGGDGVIPLDGLPALAGLPLRLSLQDATLVFDGEGCREAGGQVRVELALPAPSLPPLILAGSPACDGGVARLALTAEDPGHPLAFEADVGVEADGRYRVHALARTDDPAARLALLAAGFQDGPGGLARVDDGSLL